MHPRRIVLDFSAAPVHWIPGQPEMAQVLNAISTNNPQLEQFLVKVVMQCRNALPADETALREDARVFMAQESAHFKTHQAFNRILYEAGYDELPEREAQMRQDYDGFLNDRGLRFCLAYSEGFETFGPVFSHYFFEKVADRLARSDQAVADLWRWHFAEEYEHRTVCNYLYERLYGGYFYRIYGLGYAFVHLMSYVFRVANYMIKEDRQRGTIGTRLRDRLRYLSFSTSLLTYVISRSLRALAPNYDPGMLPAPRSAIAFLEDVDRQLGIDTHSPAAPERSA